MQFNPQFLHAYNLHHVVLQKSISIEAAFIQWNAASSYFLRISLQMYEATRVEEKSTHMTFYSKYEEIRQLYNSFLIPPSIIFMRTHTV
ncbi:hypothetical protein VN97_g7635 [Penicillium thymicola]|uniref:Uncharacterized protein n=1 Tax=Penicillium thymicola TaxID=293382 RepID=A0AAI9TG18_PENTH|nr:hypothetical protein VN97_g7635 [Penicillium thymicola]